MKPINSPREFETVLEAERAIVFIFFPWSRGSVQSEKIVTEWQRQPHPHHFPIYQLIPDRHPFSWQWLDTIFGEIPDEDRTRGAVVWLHKGVVAALVPDASITGAKPLTRITNDYFTLGKSFTAEAIASLQGEAAPFNLELLKTLCCPETHQSLALADTAALDKINQRLAAGGLRNRAGQPVCDKIEDGLVRADGRYLYPMRRNIPVLLVDEAIPLA